MQSTSTVYSLPPPPPSEPPPPPSPPLPPTASLPPFGCCKHLLCSVFKIVYSASLCYFQAFIFHNGFNMGYPHIFCLISDELVIIDDFRNSTEGSPRHYSQVLVMSVCIWLCFMLQVLMEMFICAH